MTISIDTFLENTKEYVKKVKKGETIIIVDYDGRDIIMKKINYINNYIGDNI